ncbi:MAG: hypothetical protein WCL02_02670 [bacterium]
MAINNPLTQNLNDINERIRNRQDLSNIANEQLFGLLNNTPQKNLIIDGTMALHLNNLPNLLNIQQDIINTRNQLPNQAAGNNTTNTVINPILLTNSIIIQQNISQTNQQISTLPTRINNETQQIEAQSYGQVYNGNQNQQEQQRKAWIFQEKTTRVTPLQAELTQHQQNLTILQQLLPLQQMRDVFQNVIGNINNNPNPNTRV